MVRNFWLILLLATLGCSGGIVSAAAFKLNNGETVTGELVLDSANDAGIQIKTEEGKYERVSWANFSQEDLKSMVKTPKLQPLVEPFIEISQDERIRKTEVKITPPPRLERPASRSLLGAMFSSGLGVFIILLLYAANLYAAYEVAIFRGLQLGTVIGVSAVAPLFGPIIFLSLRPKVVPTEPIVAAGEAASAETSAQEEVINPMQDTHVQHPALKLAHSDTDTAAKPAVPATQVFQRGQFTFNRRFFETKFPGFFGVIRREADRDMVLVIKSSRGEYVGQRISRIAASDLHLHVQRGQASEEVMIPFTEIQEIRLKHKNA